MLTLHKAGKVYKGTYVQHGKTYKVVAKGGNADGAGQITLTLTPGAVSTMCGLQGAKLYCSTNTGMAIVRSRLSDAERVLDLRQRASLLVADAALRLRDPLGDVQHELPVGLLLLGRLRPEQRDRRAERLERLRLDLVAAS